LNPANNGPKFAGLNTNKKLYNKTDLCCFMDSNDYRSGRAKLLTGLALGPIMERS
jgi:hypothetical protein